MLVVVGPSRHVGPRFTSLALHMSKRRSTVAGGSAVNVHQEPHGNNIGAGGAGASRRSRLAVARISRPRPNHQKPSRGVAARLAAFTDLFAFFRTTLLSSTKSFGRYASRPPVTRVRR